MVAHLCYSMPVDGQWLVQPIDNFDNQTVIHIQSFNCFGKLTIHSDHLPKHSTRVHTGIIQKHTSRIMDSIMDDMQPCTVCLF